MPIFSGRSIFPVWWFPWLIEEHNIDKEKPIFAGVGNGGFSLRKVNKMYQILSSKKPIYKPSHIRSKLNFKRKRSQIVTLFKYITQCLGYHNSIAYILKTNKENEDRFWVSAFHHSCGVAITSICENNQDENIHFNIFTDESFAEGQKQSLLSVADHYKQTITFYTLNTSRLQDLPLAGYSRAIYYRLLMTNTLPSSIEKIIYFDCDIVVRKSLKELWNEDIEEYSLGAVKDQLLHNSIFEYNRLKYDYNKGYFNSGVLLINLKKWRHELEGLVLNNQIFGGVGVVMMHRYEFASQKTQDELDKILTLLKKNPSVHFYTFRQLKQDGIFISSIQSEDLKRQNLLSKLIHQKGVFISLKDINTLKLLNALIYLLLFYLAYIITQSVLLKKHQHNSIQTAALVLAGVLVFCSSWWAAFLRINNKSTVFAPNYWLGHKEKKTFPAGIKCDDFQWIDP